MVYKKKIGSDTYISVQQHNGHKKIMMLKNSWIQFRSRITSKFDTESKAPLKGNNMTVPRGKCWTAL